MNVLRFAQYAACLFLASPALAQADDKITLSFNERPPYIIPAADGSASGLTASPAGINAKTFQQLQMADIPNGDYRYIMCSKQVSDEVIGKLNKAIAARKPAVQ
ncbi:hypothetical protein ACFDR9_000705 [Janthinobacterium sp. CG_23.3]|uniref:hypothetical protein n=1 Tax=Janthinobacterium sp. CG_23.3 TaxID=3349634 RepID=UPI0038D4A4F9